MRSEEVRAALRAQPFRPFVIHLPEGRTVKVAHHDFALLAPNGRSIDVYEVNNNKQKLNLIDVMLISSLEFEEVPYVTEEAMA
jgi:hypothetical protein